MPRPATARPLPGPVTRIGAEARLALVESLLASGDLAACARSAVEWLGTHAGVRQAVCAVMDLDGGRLVGVAGYGVPAEAVAGFSLDLDDRGHPLAAALAGTRPVVFRSLRLGRSRRRRIPIDVVPFLAAPIGARDAGTGPGIGLLLAGAADGRAHEAVTWLAATVGKRLGHLSPPRGLAEGERLFRRERTLLYSIINVVPDPILLTDTEGRMLVANARAERLFAAGEGASPGRRRAVALNNMFLSAALSRTAVDDAVSVRRELLLVDPEDGSDLLFELLSSVVDDPREGTEVLSILHDVTDLRRAMQEIEENYRRLRVAEAETRAERDRLTLILDSVADPILVTDPAGNIELMNQPAERLFTVRSDGAGTDSERRVQANDARFSSFVSSLYTSPDTRWRGVLELVDPETGAALPVEAFAGQVFSDRKEVAGVVTILHDRSEAVEKAALYEQLERASENLKVKVRQATAELARQNRILRRQALELERASALKSRFLANISHELRTPLNAILGYTNILLQGAYGGLNERQARGLARVESNGRHLLSIINDLLDIARIEAGKMPVNLDDTSIPELLTEVMTEMEPIIARSRLDVSLEVEPNLPVIRSDRKKVKQIVMNFVSNALKFTPEGRVKIRAAYDPARGEASIAVTDTGIGIAGQDFDKIFDDFRQVDGSLTRKYGGTGLGLSICRRLAAILGGRISLASTLGSGSTFTLHLPRRGGDA